MKTLSITNKLGMQLQITLIFILLNITGCEKNSDFPHSKLNQVEFELVVLDDQDIEVASIEQGKDLKFALKLINNSDQDLDWYYDYTCQILQSNDFLLVHQLTQSGESNSNYIPVGTPYLKPINCQTINLPAERIAPGESYIIKLMWSDNPENEPLNKGKHYVSANFSLTTGEERKQWLLRSDFEIY